MSRGRRWLERIKSLLILILTCSALYLAWRTELFQRFLPDHLPADAAEPSAMVSSYTAAAKPLYAAVTGTSGLVYGVGYDDGAMDELLQTFRSVLGETFGSASAPEPVEENSWRAALLEPGLFLDYGMPVSLNVLASWMGTAAAFSPEQRAGRLLLSLREMEHVDLYYLNEQGTAYRCSTVALSDALYAGINSFLPNGTEFAMQLASLASCDPYALILRDLPELDAVNASDGGRDAAFRTAAELCRVRLNSGSSFQEQNGIVYLGEEGRLRLEADGSFRYLAAEDKALGEAREEADQIELSRSFLSQLADSCGGIGALEYSGMRNGEAGTTYLFDYRVNGVRVKLNSGSAAWAVFRDGQLVEIGLRPRTYSPGGTQADCIPPLQAAAAAGSMQPGGTPELILSDPGGSAVISPLWTMRERSA